MRSIVFLVVVSLSVLFLFPQYSFAYGAELAPFKSKEGSNHFVFSWSPRVQALYQDYSGSQGSRILYKTVTAYSSTVDQTDSTPFIAASGQRVFDGIVASNFLQFGTKVKMPNLFGDKVFIVGDRMHNRFSNRIDVWFQSRAQAEKFGKRFAKIVVLEG